MPFSNIKPNIQGELWASYATRKFDHMLCEEPNKIKSRRDQRPQYNKHAIWTSTFNSEQCTHKTTLFFSYHPLKINKFSESS